MISRSDAAVSSYEDDVTLLFDSLSLLHKYQVIRFLYKELLDTRISEIDQKISALMEDIDE